MQFARARLWIAILAFAAWVSWLGYQAWSRGRDYPVLSHSQFLVSTLDVIADVKAGPDEPAVSPYPPDAVTIRPDPIVTIRQVHWPASAAELVGKTIRVANLASSFGYRGPGEYILPLVRGEGADEYRVASLPRSPGFDSFASPPHFIYPVTPLTWRQLEAIPKSY
jgi:hypothetical protein